MLSVIFSISACPTCNDFHGLVQKIMELQDILAKTSGKVSVFALLSTQIKGRETVGHVLHF